MSKTRISKQQQNIEKVAEGLALLKASRTELEALLPMYMEWSVEAAMLGDDGYSDQLLQESEETMNFISDLKILELEIRSGAVTAKMFTNLRKLPDAVRACRGLLKAGPNLEKVGKSLGSFRDDLTNARGSLRDLRGVLARKKRSLDISEFGIKSADSAKLSALKAERERLIIKEMQKRKESAEVVHPSESTERDAADCIDIDKIIEDEDKK